ncbi:hypothetical protein ACPEEZ_12720 [Frigoribacterium sp. 2-23]|uniref:hypothetical protein n=1 Tax=Frigoribacterium sp. 2-23 TaxID=3415006 RepID=UPI003C6FF321
MTRVPGAVGHEPSSLDRAHLPLPRGTAIVVATVFVATHVVISVMSASGATDPRQWLALAAVAVAAGLVVAQAPRRLGRVSAWTAVALTTLVTLLLVLGLSPSPGQPGFTAWHLGAVSLLLFSIAVRGRFLAACTGQLLVIVIGITWGVVAADDAGQGFDLVIRHVGTFVIGMVFAFGLRRLAGDLGRAREVEAERRAEAVVERARADERRHETQRLLAVAGPALEAITRQAESSAEQRLIYLTVEAALRDALRGRLLSREPVIEEARLARRRGVRVLLLDDSGVDAPDDVADQAALWVAARLRAVQGDSFTARITRVRPPAAGSAPPLGAEAEGGAAAADGTEVVGRELLELSVVDSTGHMVMTLDAAGSPESVTLPVGGWGATRTPSRPLKGGQ